MTAQAAHHSDASIPPVEDALTWLIALEEDPDDAVLRARFEAWRARNPAAWDEASNVWLLVGEAAE
ncbi:MAG TPA: DUF4880 domain-containing protein, partial [Dongiaceae bacterium]|nr:DUF4880 domain-containing protein [Dongiaceae bacterium]